jgi:hypothetical protein
MGASTDPLVAIAYRHLLKGPRTDRLVAESYKQGAQLTPSSMDVVAGISGFVVDFAFTKSHRNRSKVQNPESCMISSVLLWALYKNVCNLLLRCSESCH